MFLQYVKICEFHLVGIESNETVIFQCVVDCTVLGTVHLTWREGGGGGYGFLFRSELFFFRTTREVEYLFFCRGKCQNSTLGYMTKTLNQILFFLHQNQNIFFSNIGNQNTWKKNIPPPPFKLNGRPLKLNAVVNEKIRLFLYISYLDLFFSINAVNLRKILS